MSGPHESEMSEKTVSVFPAVQHRHADGDIVTVTLRRKDGSYSADCPGCQTRFIYRKPAPSERAHYKSPLLPEIKGNFDSGDR
jgi:hypothetical protein